MKLSTLKFAIDCLVKKHGDLNVTAFCSHGAEAGFHRANLGWSDAIEVVENPNGSITFIFLYKHTDIGRMRRVLRVNEDILQKMWKRRTK